MKTYEQMRSEAFESNLSYELQTLKYKQFSDNLNLVSSLISIQSMQINCLIMQGLNPNMFGKVE